MAVTKESLAATVYRYHGGLSKSEASKIINIIFEAIRGKLAQKEKIHLIGFGSIEGVVRKGRKGKNPLTGKDFFIAEKLSIKFKPSKKLIEMIN
ncbi:MAG: HU family DNA-binding protein [Acidobacteriota bacterium]